MRTDIRLPNASQFDRQTRT